MTRSKVPFGLDPCLDFLPTFFVLVLCCKMQMSERRQVFDEVCAAQPKYGDLAEPLHAMHHSGALGKQWGSGRLVHYANVNSGNAAPTPSLLGTDRPLQQGR